MEDKLETSVVFWHRRDEIPPRDGFYIVAIDNAVTTVAEYNRGEWIIFSGHFTYLITGWAELPKLNFINEKD